MGWTVDGVKASRGRRGCFTDSGRFDRDGDRGRLGIRGLKLGWEGFNEGRLSFAYPMYNG